MKNNMPIKIFALSLICFMVIVSMSKAEKPADNTATQIAANVALDNAIMAARIDTALKLNPSLHLLPIDESVENRVVTLSGTVQNRTQSALVEEVVKAIDKTLRIKNDLVIDEHFIVEKEQSVFNTIRDATIKANIQSKFLLENDIPSMEISVTSEDAIVTLEGSVADHVVKDLAYQLVKNTEGVIDVVNNLTISVANEENQ